MNSLHMTEDVEASPKRPYRMRPNPTCARRSPPLEKVEETVEEQELYPAPLNSRQLSKERQSNESPGAAPQAGQFMCTPRSRSSSKERVGKPEHSPLTQSADADQFKCPEEPSPSAPHSSRKKENWRTPSKERTPSQDRRCSRDQYEVMPSARSSFSRWSYDEFRSWSTSSRVMSPNQTITMSRMTSPKATPRLGSKGTVASSRKFSKRSVRSNPLSLASWSRPLPSWSSRASRISDDEITYRARLGYSILYGFAQWFGPHHFDRDGDGKFDARDVQRMQNHLGRRLHISFTAPTGKATKKAQKRRGVTANPVEGVKELPTNRTLFERGVGEVAGDFKVVGDVAEEEVIREHLRQFWPWFSIAWALVILGVWVGYAAQTDRYERVAINAAYSEEWVLRRLPNPMQSVHVCMQHCTEHNDCRGFAYDFWPGSSCVLLRVMAEEDGECRHLREWCGVYQYRKAPFRANDILSLKAGLETAYPGLTDLAARDFCQEGLENEMLWRLISYQLSHVGLPHVMFNAMLLLAFGIPLEGAYGTVWMGVLWTLGVLGGGLAWLVWDAHIPTVGASGGCYSLIGMHLADTFLNWHCKKLRWIILIVCLVVVCIEVILLFGMLGMDGLVNSNPSVHVGGCVAGSIAGVVFGLDLQASKGKDYVKSFTCLSGACLAFAAIAWWSFANPFPATRNIFEEEAYCWLGQVCLEPEHPGPQALCDYTCVRCDSRACMESWYPKDEHGEKNKATYGTARASRSSCAFMGFSDEYHFAPE